MAPEGEPGGNGRDAREAARLPVVPETTAQRAAPRIALGCAVLSLALWSLSLPLQCAVRAALVGGFAFGDGTLLGLCLALVTRSRRPAAIYLWLLLAGATLWPIWHGWPLWHGWPIGDPSTIQLWRGAPILLTSYYEMLSLGLFLFGMPFPFVRFGHHGPDPPHQGGDPAETSET